MKNLFIFYLLFFLTFDLLAQTPQAIPYQAVARNSAGVPLSNQNIKVRFSIRDSILSGIIIYRETHTATTNNLGLFNLNVGHGTPTTGTFAAVNWGKNVKFLQVEMDPAGGTTFTDLGTTQMMSVPYALQANAIKMKTSVTGDTLYTGSGEYLIIPGISSANLIATDIDGQTYTTVTIGTQVWMKENLKVSKYRNGDPIPTNLNDSQWSTSSSGAYSIYNNNTANNATYGKLYNWYAVVDSRGLCPAGWHVPTDDEWKTLESYLGVPISELDLILGRGAASNVGGNLKSTALLWTSPNTGASNLTGFSGLPGGARSSAGFISGLNIEGSWWSKTGAVNNAYSRTLRNSENTIVRGYNTRSYGFSVRCLKD